MKTAPKRQKTVRRPVSSACIKCGYPKYEHVQVPALYNGDVVFICPDNVYQAPKETE
jgi:hypothetical protein